MIKIIKRVIVHSVSLDGEMDYTILESGYRYSQSDQMRFQYKLRTGG